jgi:hypothetical protein
MHIRPPSSIIMQPPVPVTTLGLFTQASNTSFASPLNLFGEIQSVSLLVEEKLIWHLSPRTTTSFFAQTGLPSPPLSLAKFSSSITQSLIDTKPQRDELHTGEALFTTSWSGTDFSMCSIWVDPYNAGIAVTMIGRIERREKINA